MNSVVTAIQRHVEHLKETDQAMSNINQSGKYNRAHRFAEFGLSLVIRNNEELGYENLRCGALRGNRKAQFFYGVHLLKKGKLKHAMMFLAAATGNTANRPQVVATSYITPNFPVRSTLSYANSSDLNALYSDAVILNDEKAKASHAVRLFSATAALLKDPTHEQAPSMAEHLFKQFSNIKSYKTITMATHAIMPDSTTLHIDLLPEAVDAWVRHQRIKSLGGKRALNTPYLMG